MIDSAKPLFAWARLSPDVSLAHDEIHIWRAALDTLIPELPSLAGALSLDELTRAEQYHFERDRSRFVIRRGLLRILLGQYLDLEPEQISFCCEFGGKPMLSKENGSAGLHFNLSHSDDVALFGFARSPIGLDIERMRSISDVDEIASKILSLAEIGLMNAKPANEKLELFFQLWTQKEAILKATGEGLAGIHLRSEFPASEWLLFKLTPFPGVAGALATKQPLARVTCFSLDIRREPHRFPEQFPS